MSSAERQVAIFTSADGEASLEVQLDQDTVWLSQKQMADLFEKDTDTVGLHIRNIFKEGELEPEVTTEESSVVQKEGGRQVRRKINVYNLERPGGVDPADRRKPAGREGHHRQGDRQFDQPEQRLSNEL